MAASESSTLASSFSESMYSISTAELDVLPHHRDPHLLRRALERGDEPLPATQVRPRRPDVEAVHDRLVDALAVQLERKLVDRLNVGGGDHRLLVHVAEERELAAHRLREDPVGAAQQDVGRDADLAQLLDRVLGGLGLELARARHVGHERHVGVEDVLPPQVLPKLPDRLEEGERLDVADGPPDLDDQHVHLLSHGADVLLDLVGHVRDDLHRRAQVLPLPLAADHALVHAAGGEVVLLGEAHRREALVVTEVQVGLGAVLGHVDLAVLDRVHGARVDVQVGVELDEADAEAARLQERPDRGGGEPLPDAGKHASRDEDVLARARHGSLPPGRNHREDYPPKGRT
jgi:hypothetical protein